MFVFGIYTCFEGRFYLAMIFAKAHTSKDVPKVGLMHAAEGRCLSAGLMDHVVCQKELGSVQATVSLVASLISI